MGLRIRYAMTVAAVLGLACTTHAQDVGRDADLLLQLASLYGQLSAASAVAQTCTTVVTRQRAYFQTMEIAANLVRALPSNTHAAAAAVEAEAIARYQRMAPELRCAEAEANHSTIVAGLLRMPAPAAPR